MEAVRADTGRLSAEAESDRRILSTSTKQSWTPTSSPHSVRTRHHRLRRASVGPSRPPHAGWSRSSSVTWRCYRSPARPWRWNWTRHRRSPQPSPPSATPPNRLTPTASSSTRYGESHCRPRSGFGICPLLDQDAAAVAVPRMSRLFGDNGDDPRSASPKPSSPSTSVVTDTRTGPPDHYTPA